MENKVRFVDMAIYIDTHVYEENHDASRIYMYLRKLLCMLAYKRGYFKTKEQFEDFSILGATRVYLRLTNEKQFLPDDDPKKLPRVKSVLNYLKTILYPLKVDYQRLTFGKVISTDFDGKDATEGIEKSLLNIFKESAVGFQQSECMNYFAKLPSIIKQEIKNTPYANDKALAQNIYTSCLITLLRNITLSKDNLKRFNIEDRTRCLNIEDTAQSVYAQEKESALQLYHLDDEYRDYIELLTNKIRKIVTKEISEIIDYYEPTQDMLEDVLMQPLAELGEDDD